jgi:hypothetical protein
MAPYNPPIAHYCHISVNDYDEEHILKAIGKNGFFFKKITEDCNANYIWWNKEKCIIEIWGSYKCMKITKYNVEYHLKNVRNIDYKYNHQYLPFFDFDPRKKSL